MGLFSSSKKKADEPSKNKVWHIDEMRSVQCENVTTESNYNNIRYIIQEMAKNHQELSDKMDKILNENRELREKCASLEKTVNTFTR